MIYLLFLISWLFPYCGSALDITPLKKIPESANFLYELKDLKETDLSQAELSNANNEFRNCLAPRINNQGVMICNQSDRGYIKDAGLREISPQISSMTSHCHGLNDKGDLLLRFQRSPSDIEWWVWPQKNLYKNNPFPLKLSCTLGRNLVFSAMNSSKVIVGTLKPAGRLQPVIWTLEEGLCALGDYLGWEFEGSAVGINEKNTLAGYLQEGDEQLVFAWNKKWGLESLKSFRWKWENLTRLPLIGKIHFADLIIGENDLVYGTFWLEGKEDQIYAFWWDPKSDELRRLDLKGMRIHAVSKDGTFVGSWNGQAALCDIGNTPYLLKDLIVALDSSWELLDATDINDRGDIVGYGRQNNAIRYFQISPIKHNRH